MLQFFLVEIQKSWLTEIRSQKSSGFFLLKVFSAKFSLLFSFKDIFTPLFLFLSLSLTHTHTNTPTHILSLLVSHTHTHTYIISLSHALTHTHTLHISITLSLSNSWYYQILGSLFVFLSLLFVVSLFQLPQNFIYMFWFSLFLKLSVFTFYVAALHLVHSLHLKKSMS